MLRGRSRFYVSAVIVVATSVAWTLWEVTFRYYGGSRTSGPLLLNASPEAAAAAAVVWLLSVVVVGLAGFLVARLVRGE
jgi:hypothetical protein